MKKYLSKLMLAVALIVCSFVLLTANVSAAYIDPATVGMAATAIGGIVVACGAFFLIWWRKLKHNVSEKLGIDENANKEVEADVEITLDEEGVENVPTEDAPAAEATVEEAPVEASKTE